MTAAGSAEGEPAVVGSGRRTPGTLWLLRHASPDAAPGLCYGASEVPVPAAATAAVAARIAPLLPRGIAMWHSPRARCAALAAAIERLRPDAALRADGRIAELDFGAWEGCRWDAIALDQLAGWTADFADAPAGGTGESQRQFLCRVGAAWDDWRSGGGDALWVTHGGVAHAVELLASGVRDPVDAADWPRDALAFGAWRVLTCQPK